MSERRAIARDTRWSLVAEIAKFASGIGVFLLVARSLGRVGYGQLGAIGAITVAIAPFANAGASLLLVQRVRREQRDVDDSFRTAFTTVWVGGIVASFVSVAVTAAVVPSAPWQAMVLLAAGELVFSAVVSLCAYLAMSCSDLRTYALVVTGTAAARLGAAVLFFAAGGDSVTGWAMLQTVAAAATMAVVLGVAQRRFGVHLRRGRVTRRDVSEGMPYAASLAAFSAQDGIDKPLMVRYGWNDDAGLYTAAYRVPALTFIPVQALIVATINRSFSEGREGIAASMRLARRLLVPSLAYASAVAVAMVAFAPLFRPVLGDDFDGAITIVRWLAFIPVVRALQYFPANALSGAGFQRQRLGALVVTLVVNLVLCIALIPAHSWRGAVAATAASECTYAVLLWTIAAVQLRRARLTPPSPPLHP